MRRIIVAAALVVIGLSAVLVGTASAATPALSAKVTATCTVPKDGTSCTAKVGDLDVTITVGAAGVSCDAVNADGLRVCSKQVDTGGTSPSTRNCPRGEHWDGRDNRCERDGSGPIYSGPYNSCSDYARSDLRDFRRGDARYRADWDRNNNGVACDSSDVIVSENGDCVTYREGVRDYGTRYNSLYNQRIDQARSVNSDGGRSVTDRERRAINDAADLRDFRSRYDTDLGRMRTICQDKTPPVVIVTEAPAAPVTVTAAPPAPPAPSVGSIPSGSVNTGGWSAAFTLAHNRAV